MTREDFEKTYTVVQDLRTTRPGDIIFGKDEKDRDKIAIYLGDGRAAGFFGLHAYPQIGIIEGIVLGPDGDFNFAVKHQLNVTEFYAAENWDQFGEEILEGVGIVGNGAESFVGINLEGLESRPFLSRDSSFYYKGIPETGYYLGSTSLGDMIWSFLTQVVDYLVGLMTLGVKIQLIGWTSIVENILQDFVNYATGTPLKEKVNIEAIVFNKVPILDINVFSTLAAGKRMPESSVMYTIRNTVATWYNVFRNISIVALLLVLIYLGIKMAITTIASEKAEYKNMLVSWITAFIIVFFIHYFMILVISFNNVIIDICIKTAGAEEVSIYEKIFEQAYNLKASVGMPATIVYMVLVYYTARYLFTYFKRLLVVTVLIAVAPFVGISYAMDKIKNGKNKSGSLQRWMSEFCTNVLIQSVHALLYAIFVVFAFKIVSTSFAGLIIGCICLNFMLKAEKLIKDMFKLKGNSTKDISTKSAALVATGAVLSNTKKYAKGIDKAVGSPVKKTKDKAYDSYFKGRASELGYKNEDIEKFSKLEKGKIKESDLTSYQKERYKEYKKDKKKEKEAVGQAVASIGNVFKGSATILTTIPTMVAHGPVAGAVSGYVAARSITMSMTNFINSKNLGEKKLSAPKKKPDDERYKAKPHEEEASSRLVPRGMPEMSKVRSLYRGEELDKQAKVKVIQISKVGVFKVRRKHNVDIIKVTTKTMGALSVEDATNDQIIEMVKVSLGKEPPKDLQTIIDKQVKKDKRLSEDGLKSIISKAGRAYDKEHVSELTLLKKFEDSLATVLTMRGNDELRDVVSGMVLGKAIGELTRDELNEINHSMVGSKVKNEDKIVDSVLVDVLAKQVSIEGLGRESEISAKLSPEIKAKLSEFIVDRTVEKKEEVLKIMDDKDKDLAIKGMDWEDLESMTDNLKEEAAKYVPKEYREIAAIALERKQMYKIQGVREDKAIMKTLSLINGMIDKVQGDEV